MPNGRRQWIGIVAIRPQILYRSCVYDAGDRGALLVPVAQCPGPGAIAQAHALPCGRHNSGQLSLNGSLCSLMKKIITGPGHAACHFHMHCPCLYTDRHNELILVCVS